MSEATMYAVKKSIGLVFIAGVLAIFCLDVALIIQNGSLNKQMAAPPALLLQVGTGSSDWKTLRLMNRGLSLGGFKATCNAGEEGIELSGLQ